MEILRKVKAMSSGNRFIRMIGRNIPNILSTIRLLLVPVFAILYFSGRENDRMYSIIVYIAAVSTDILDGYIARQFKLISNFGRIIDPLADKLMALTVLVSITITKIMPIWITVVFFVKELLMFLGGSFIHQKFKLEMPPSNIFGKASAVSLFVLCVSMMMFEDISNVVVTLLTILTLLLAALALSSYIMTYIRVVNNRNKKA